MNNGTRVRALALLAIGGAALGGTAAAAHADAAPLGGLSHLGDLKLYPLANGGLDLLSNSLDTDVSGLPVSTAQVSKYFETGVPLNQVPVVDTVLGAPAPGN